MAAPRVVVAIIPPTNDIDPHPDAAFRRGNVTGLPNDVRDLPALAAHLSSLYTIPVGSTFTILGKLEEEDPRAYWINFDEFPEGAFPEGVFPQGNFLYVRIVLPSAGKGSKLLTNILRRLDALGAEVSTTRCASRMNEVDFALLVSALRICGPLNEDIQGKDIGEDILESMLGDEEYWDERYEEQQRERYCKDVKGWLAATKKNRQITWVNGNKETIRRRFEGLPFNVSSKNDLVAMSKRFQRLYGQGCLLGVELRRKKLTRKSLRQAMVEFFLWADASVFPFVQLITDMQKGGVAYYCKSIDARTGIQLRCVILKNMTEVRDFVSQVGAGFPDDIGGDAPGGHLIIPETFDYPPRKKFSSGQQQQGTGEELANKARIALWTIGARLLENEGDVANLADVMDLDSFQRQEVY